MSRRKLGGVALVVAAACHAAPTPAPVVSNQASARAAVAPADGLRDGALWTCQIEDYDPQPCRLERVDTGWRLTKLLGSQRFRADAAFAGARLRLDGEFFCPWGDCTTAISWALERDARGVYRPLDRAENEAPAAGPLELYYSDADDRAYGAAGYGGLTGDER